MSTSDIISEIESTIEELTEQAESLRDKAEATINHAYNINAKVVNSSERYVPLDDQPYGEELISTNGMVESINEQLVELEQLEGEEDPSKAINAIQIIEKTIKEHEETLQECFTDGFVEEANQENDD